MFFVLLTFWDPTLCCCAKEENERPLLHLPVQFGSVPAFCKTNKQTNKQKTSETENTSQENKGVENHYLFDVQ